MLSCRKYEKILCGILDICEIMEVIIEITVDLLNMNKK